LLIERFVRTLVVEFLTEMIELLLLRAEAAGRGSCGLGLECSVHAFMTPILLWFAGFNQLGHDT